jgi:hypothetical protein
MFEVGNIVKWTDEKKERMIPFHQKFRYEITCISKDGLKIAIKAISNEYLINLLTEPEGIIRDIEYERQLKMSKFIKKKKCWNIFKRK